MSEEESEPGKFNQALGVLGVLDGVYLLCEWIKRVLAPSGALGMSVIFSVRQNRRGARKKKKAKTVVMWADFYSATYGIQSILCFVSREISESRSM